MPPSKKKKKKGKHRMRGSSQNTATGGPASSSTIQKGMVALALEQTAAWKSTYRDMLVMREAAWDRVMDHIGSVRRGGRSSHSNESSRSEMSVTGLRDDGVKSGMEEILLGHEPGTSAGRDGTRGGALTTAERVEEVKKYRTQIREFANTCLELIDLERSIRTASAQDAPLTDEAQSLKARLKSERLVYDIIAARFLEDQYGSEIEDPDEDRSSELLTALTELADLDTSSEWRTEPYQAGTVRNRHSLPGRPSLEIRRWPSDVFEAKLKIDDSLGGISERARDRLTSAMLFNEVGPEDDCKIWNDSVDPKSWGASVLPQDWSVPATIARKISNLVDELLGERTYLHEALSDRSKRLGMFACAGDAAGIDEAVSLAQACQVADRWVEFIPDAVERFWSDYALAQRQSMESFRFSISELNTAATDANVKTALDSFVAITKRMTDSHRFAVVSLADARRRLSTKSEDQAILSQLHNDALASSRAIEERLLVDIADLRAKSALTTLPMPRGEETTARAILTYLSSFESAPDTATA